MHFRAFLAALSFLFMPLVAGAAGANYTEDTDYRTIKPPVSVDVPKGKVQVMELFWYGCPHCHDLDPYLTTWVKSKPSSVEFVRVPAVFSKFQPDGSLNPWYLDAKAFYAAQALGVGEKIHAALFKAIHEERRSIRTEEDLTKFFAEQGVAAKDFKSAFDSFMVDAKVARAMDITKASGITGVPAIIVDGKYQVLGKRATDFPDYLTIADFLINKERGLR